ncbi:hypothetical protein [Halococcoides cellulosivorans]|uniref:Pyruvate kinase C-terminal domain-containing protein n=1 Tax=Halococcoides cellulosivorans TaxID=1679096 RepID=A0A2R4WZ74_9EURY|nr:hypothetical protein [Halococcoides cellulosivorans]AWB26841.1 hypothetical protein HARCEL1_03470 [Halococcoides cellulosivorans]
MHATDDRSTDEVLAIAADRAAEDDYPVVVASTTGATGEAAAEQIDRQVTVVGHAAGFDDPNTQEFDADARAAIEAAGGTVLTGTMPFHTVNRAIDGRGGASPSTVAADTLRLFGQGTKVALEVVTIAADAGAIGVGQPVVGVGGTGEGCDTVLVVEAATSADLFEARVREVVAKPTDPANMPFY